jgi:hypothetical protein
VNYWEDFDECYVCGYDGLDSHYHCANCWEVASSIGHYVYEPVRKSGRFTCEQKPRP